MIISAAGPGRRRARRVGLGGGSEERPSGCRCRCRTAIGARVAIVRTVVQLAIGGCPRLTDGRHSTPVAWALSGIPWARSVGVRLKEQVGGASSRERNMSGKTFQRQHSLIVPAPRVPGEGGGEVTGP